MQTLHRLHIFPVISSYGMNSVVNCHVFRAGCKYPQFKEESEFSAVSGVSPNWTCLFHRSSKCFPRRASSSATRGRAGLWGAFGSCLAQVDLRHGGLCPGGGYLTARSSSISFTRPSPWFRVNEARYCARSRIRGSAYCRLSGTCRQAAFQIALDKALNSLPYPAKPGVFLTVLYFLAVERTPRMHPTPASNRWRGARCVGRWDTRTAIAKNGVHSLGMIFCFNAAPAALLANVQPVIIRLGSSSRNMQLISSHSRRTSARAGGA